MNDRMGIAMRGFARLAILAAFVGSMTLATEAETAADPAEGHRLALMICSACHVVASDQQSPPVLRHPAPNFQAVAARPGTSAASLQRFILTTHAEIATPAGMPNPRLTEDQAAEIASYIVSLRSAKPAAPK
jgi:mono/diheme cytochrome c family protein